MIETHSKISLYAQYAASIREKIERGEIKPGDRLPSILNAAEEAALSPGTIKQAYKVLTEEGYVTMIQGRDKKCRLRFYSLQNRSRFFLRLPRLP